MIVNPEQVDFFKEIARNQFSLKIINELGSDSLQPILLLTESIGDIYKFLPYESFKKVTIFTRHEEKDLLKDYNPNSILHVSSLISFTNFTGTYIMIEVVNRHNFRVILDNEDGWENLKDSAIIYKYIQSSDEEFIYARTIVSKLLPIPGADSYFSIQTFKHLEKALDEYGIKRAKLSNCLFLKKAWLDENRIFFKPSPEEHLRDSLTDFLSLTFREEVRPEQIVDSSHPVDIKVTWQMINRIALIEIKWLGKSLNSSGDKFSSVYNDARAREGAKQLSDYLDANKIQAPDKFSKGYLVVFDARRWRTKTTSTEINSADAMYYKNKFLEFDPQYDLIRQDFAKPIRFFMEPKLTING